MARKALGRGISALLGETRPPAGDTGSEETSGSEKNTKFEKDIEIDIELISPNADQPRTNFPETELEELAQSIRTNGIVQPILLRPAKGESANNKSKRPEAATKFEIVAGERRWRAAQRAGLKKIPAIVREIDDAQMLQIALIENIQRQELNPVEEALAYKNLIGDLGLTQQEVADRVGKTRTFIANYLRLLNLPKPILKFLAEGGLSVGHAKALLSILDPKRQKELANEILSKGLSVREAENAAKARPLGASKSKKAEELKDPNIGNAETKLRRLYSTQVRIIPARDGRSGRIEFEIYGKEDLNRIYDLLTRK
ncbi:MAG: ParB/RepB/Spo0J family partition protein [Pyrinomonadaceae bacterium]